MVVYRGNDLIVNADGIFLMKAVDPFLLEFILIIRDHLTADVAEFLRSREFLSIDGINGIVFQFGNLSSFFLNTTLSTRLLSPSLKMPFSTRMRIVLPLLNF